MWNKRLLPTVLLVANLMAPVSAYPAQQEIAGAEDSDSVRKWVIAAAHPLVDLSSDDFRDLAPMIKSVQKARVIGFGETAHQTRELQLLRLRALRALVKTGQVRALGMEAGYVETLGLNRWLIGESTSQPGFDSAFPFNGEGRLSELRAAIEWLHSWNQSLPAAKRIQFYGLDLPYGGGALRPALECIWTYLDRVDPTLAHASRESMQSALTQLGEGWPAGAKKRFDALNNNSQSALLRGVSELDQAFSSKRSRYSQATGIDEFERVRQAVAIAGQTLSFMQDPQDGSNPRDQALATNVDWILKRIPGNGKVIIWAHNAHVQKQAIEVAGTAMKPATSMGEILSDKLGPQYIAIGTAVGRLDGEANSAGTSAKVGSIDDVLDRIGVRSFFIDLHQPPPSGQAKQWLNGSHEMRFQESYLRVVPIMSFDALFFIEHVSASVRIADQAK